MEVSGKRADIVSESCEICLIEGLSRQSDGFCHECDEYMCNKCFQHHVKVKSCRNHVLSQLGQGVPLSKKQTGSNEKCKIHVKENVKYYCRKHDVVTCGDCNVADHHGCKMEFISKLADKFENSSDFKDIVRKIGKLEAARKDNKAQLDSNRKENKACLDTALAEIKKFRKDINEHLDKVEKEIIFEVNKLAKQNDDMIDEVEKMISVAEQDICDIRNSLDANMIQGDTLFIRSKEYTPKVNKTDKNVSLIRTKNVITGFTFEQEKQLADMIKSGVKLGCISRNAVGREEVSVIQKTKQPTNTVKFVMTSVTVDKHDEAKQSFMPTGVGLFGQSSPSNRGDLFGQSSPFAGGLFGQSSSSNLGGLFGQSSPSAGESFGQSSSSNLGGLFGQSSTSTGGLFGQPAANSGVFGTQSSGSGYGFGTPGSPFGSGNTAFGQTSGFDLDPRDAGFDVGSRVQHKQRRGQRRGLPTGVVTQVDPTGYVTVRWDRYGNKSRERAGAEGRFDVELLLY